MEDHMAPPPEKEGLLWISQNLQWDYLGKSGGLFWQGAILVGKSLTVQTVHSQFIGMYVNAKKGKKS